MIRFGPETGLGSVVDRVDGQPLSPPVNTVLLEDTASMTFDAREYAGANMRESFTIELEAQSLAPSTWNVSTLSLDGVDPFTIDAVTLFSASGANLNRAQLVLQQDPAIIGAGSLFQVLALTTSVTATRTGVMLSGSAAIAPEIGSLGTKLPLAVDPRRFPTINLEWAVQTTAGGAMVAVAVAQLLCSRSPVGLNNPARL